MAKKAVAAVPTFEDRVMQYRTLRDMIKEKEKALEEELAPMKQVLDQLGGVLLQMLNQTGQEAARTKAGTVYITEKVSATLADADAFRRHVIGAEQWDLLDWRCNKTAVKDFVKDNEAAPPGVNYSVIRIVGVRAPGKDDKK
jgi:hypothetical protein